MATEVTAKKWGNSLGIVLPKELVDKEHLHEDDTFLIQVVKEADLSDIFGSLPRKMSGQAFKDMVKKGWEK